jgi:thioredoxin 1
LISSNKGKDNNKNEGDIVMAGDKIVVLTKENFEQEVLKSDKPVLVDFWAQWCGPCRAVAPIIDELASEYEGRAKVCKLNVDEQGEIASQYGIMSIPTVILFKDGQAVEKIIGARAKVDFVNMLDAIL